MNYLLLGGSTTCRRESLEPYARHRNTVEPMMVEMNRKAALHTDAVDKVVKGLERNVVLDGRPNQKGTLN